MLGPRYSQGVVRFHQGEKGQPMCELFGMSSAQPATINYSLKEFSKHGGLTHLNRSGWGIGYVEDRDVRLIRDAGEMDVSPWCPSSK